MTADIARWARACLAGVVIVCSGILVAYHYGYVSLNQALSVAVFLAIANFVYMLLPFSVRGRI